MWTSDTMTFGESLVTFLIGFSIVFFALIALALFIIVSSKVINLLVKEEVPEQKPVASNVNANANTAAKVVAKEDNQEEVERLAVIISAISEEMREPVERFTIVSITEI
ncbi:OadG family protein [Fusobacterium polymorphum]|uniref:OadG family protein n=1 Tax=Fusobacterium nucleatum subsp. polymorphum TaxID=76857 RepID=UPI00300AD4A3